MTTTVCQARDKTKCRHHSSSTTSHAGTKKALTAARGALKTASSFDAYEKSATQVKKYELRTRFLSGDVLTYEEKEQAHNEMVADAESEYTATVQHGGKESEAAAARQKEWAINMAKENFQAKRGRFATLFNR